MSIVLDNPELETAVAKLAAEQGVEISQVAATALGNYLLMFAVSDAAGTRRASADELMAIGQRCANSRSDDGQFHLRSMYDENGLPV